MLASSTVIVSPFFSKDEPTVSSLLSSASSSGTSPLSSPVSSSDSVDFLIVSVLVFNSFPFSESLSSPPATHDTAMIATNTITIHFKNPPFCFFLQLGHTFAFFGISVWQCLQSFVPLLILFDSSLQFTFLSSNANPSQ